MNIINEIDIDAVLDNIDKLIYLSRYYIYDNKEYLNHIKNLKKLRNKIEDDGLSSVIRKVE